MNCKFTSWACLVLAATVSAHAGEPDKALIDRGKGLLAEGDRMAKEGNTTDAVLRYQDAFEQLLPGLRRLPFKSTVNRDVTAREELREVILREIDLDMTPEEFHASEAGLKALGFVPANVDLKELLARVYADEIAAFYDPRTDTMHLIKEPEQPARKPSFLERLLGVTGEFSPDEQKMVISHEMTHALADQHFDLQAMHESIDADDDRALALSALIEGEATLAMMGASTEDWEGEDVINMPAEQLDRMFSFLMPLLPLFGGSQMREAPGVIRESLLFPYLKGLVFCAHLTNREGWPAVDEAYTRPPLSTEQILHPAKYIEGNDPPLDVTFEGLEPGSGWTRLGDNVVGELQMSVLLRQQRGRSAAAGWGGDRYVVFEHEDGRLGVVWRTIWDTMDDAREFARAYARFQTTKLPANAESVGADPDVDVVEIERPGRRQGTIYALTRRDQEVVIVEGFDSETTHALREAAFRPQPFEKREGSASKTVSDEPADDGNGS